VPKIRGSSFVSNEAPVGESGPAYPSITTMPPGRSAVRIRASWSSFEVFSNRVDLHPALHGFHLCISECDVRKIHSCDSPALFRKVQSIPALSLY
jgi:hypothetical protein